MRMFVEFNYFHNEFSLKIIKFFYLQKILDNYYYNKNIKQFLIEIFSEKFLNKF